MLPSPDVMLQLISNLEREALSDADAAVRPPGLSTSNRPAIRIRPSPASRSHLPSRSVRHGPIAGVQPNRTLQGAHGQRHRRYAINVAVTLRALMEPSPVSYLQIRILRCEASTCNLRFVPMEKCHPWECVR